MIEQKQIALSKVGDVPRAAAALENLIERVGPSADRCGILGGQYKQMANLATDPGQQRIFLERAIKAYERGMNEDLNEYYPSSNLPRLYRRRGDDGDGDEQKAIDVATVAMAACVRARTRDPDDEWVFPTLLGAAFDQGDAAEAADLVTRIEHAGAAQFHIETTIADLRTSCELLPDEAEARMRPVLERVERLLNSGGDRGDG